MPSPGDGLELRQPAARSCSCTQQRMKDLHFDPGPVDGVLRPGHAVRGHRGAEVLRPAAHRASSTQRAAAGAEHFRYTPGEAEDASPNRVEIDLDRQVITVFQNWQPILSPRRRPGAANTSAAAPTVVSTRSRPTGPLPLLRARPTAGKRASSARCGTRTSSTAASRFTGSRRCPRIPRRTAAHASRCTSPTTSTRSCTHGESVFVVGTPKARQRLRRPGEDAADARRRRRRRPRCTPSRPRRRSRSTVTTKPSPPTTKPSPPTTKPKTPALTAEPRAARRRNSRRLSSTTSSRASATGQPAQRGIGSFGRAVVGCVGREQVPDVGVLVRGLVGAGGNGDDHDLHGRSRRRSAAARDRSGRSLRALPLGDGPRVELAGIEVATDLHPSLHVRMPAQQHPTARRMKDQR